MVGLESRTTTPLMLMLSVRLYKQKTCFQSQVSIKRQYRYINLPKPKPVLRSAAKQPAAQVRKFARV